MNPGELTSAQLDQFQDQGYLILPAVFDAQEIAKMRTEAHAILNLIINSSVAHRRRSGRLDWIETDGQQHVRKIQPINDLSLYLSRVSEDPRLLAPMRQIMHDEPILMEEKLNYKQPLPVRISHVEVRQGTDRFPIHNDWAYYQAQNYPQAIISSAISMDDSTPDNGPLHVWPGTHRTHLEHIQGPIGFEVREGLVDPKGGVDIIAPAGSVMLFHSLLVHNSRKNSTQAPRRLMIYSHYPSAFPMCFDVRNGPSRLRESPWEHEYIRMKAQGLIQDEFASNDV